MVRLKENKVNAKAYAAVATRKLHSPLWSFAFAVGGLLFATTACAFVSSMTWPIAFHLATAGDPIDRLQHALGIGFSASYLLAVGYLMFRPSFFGPILSDAARHMEHHKPPLARKVDTVSDP